MIDIDGRATSAGFGCSHALPLRFVLVGPTGLWRSDQFIDCIQMILEVNRETVNAVPEALVLNDGSKHAPGGDEASLGPPYSMMCRNL